MAQNNLINPNSDKDTVDQLDLSDQNNFPLFIKKITIDRLKQINNLSVEFKHPISIIAGVNRSGKTTILLALMGFVPVTTKPRVGSEIMLRKNGLG